MKASYNSKPVPADGEVIQYSGGKFQIPDNPIIPFIEGDGTGRDIWKASRAFLTPPSSTPTAASAKSPGLKFSPAKKPSTSSRNGCPNDTVDAIRDFRVAIKGPLTTPVGGGIRSLNVALRQLLDLYACVRPVRYFQGVPSPVKHPEKMDIVIFRENTEDVYIGIEWQSGTPEVKKLLEFLNNDMLKGGKKQIRWDSGVGIKPISPTGTKRLVRRAIKYALDTRSAIVTLVHKGNIQKFTEGAFRDWGYELASEEFRAAHRHRARKLDHRQPRQESQPHRRAERRDDRAGPRARPPKRSARTLYDEVKQMLDSIYATHGKGQWKKEADDQRPHRRFHLPAGSDARRRISGARHAQSERRLPLRRLRRAGRRTGHGARRQHRRRLRRVSKPRTAPRRNTPTRTSSIPAR